MGHTWLATLGILALMSAGCSDSGGPDLSGPAFFTGTLDGVSWVGDTTVAILSGGSTLSITGARLVSATEEQDITLSLQGFGPGIYMLADQSGPAVAALTVMHVDNHILTSMSTYLSSSQHPGELRITGISTSDSVVTGSFAFEAAAQPDTAPHHHISGGFRVRYRTQVVYPPGCPACQADIRAAAVARPGLLIGGGID